MRGDDHVIVERRGPVLVLTLNRPAARNAVTGSMATLIGEQVESADADPGIRAVVLTGTGTDAFCAGGDLKVIRRGGSVHSATHPEWGFAGIRRHFVSTPLIAAVNGPAIGGGFEICLAADLVVAARTAWFEMPEGRHGFGGNPGGAYRLANQLPPKLALEAVLVGRRLSAQDAFERGLVNQLTEPEDLLEETFRLAEAITACAPLSVAAAKRIALGVHDGLPEDEAVWASWETTLPDGA